MRHIILIIILINLCSCTVFAQNNKKTEKYPPYYACITEPQVWMYGPNEKTRERFDIYKSIGVDMVRVELAWGVAEPEEDKWDIKRIINYMKLAEEYGFKIKLIMGIVMAPPGWFMEKHPDARQYDANGVTSHFSMSYSFPEIKKIIDSKTKKIISLLKEAGVWDSVIYVIPTFGPAGEPIYPHPWTLGADYGPCQYWGYETEGQKDFAKRMKNKYVKIEKANKIWNTDFISWEDVRILKEGEKPGAYWNDYLTWYRDRKREFVKWQISNIKKNAPDKIALVYIPGTAYFQTEWDDAVATARGTDSIRIMSDSMALMKEAVKQGAWLQYTGCENEPEVARLRKYLDDNGKKDVIMWGENAGYFIYAKDPINLANIIIKNRLYGLDYTHAHFAFLMDGLKEMPGMEDYGILNDTSKKIIPNPAIMNDLKKAFLMIKEQNSKQFAN